jgi:putative transposase
VGEGGDEVSVARFIADQRTNHRVPHTLTCALLGVSLSWFYKWLDRAPTASERRRAQVDAAVAAAFTKARGLHGSPRLVDDLRAAGWVVAEKTVADSMRRQGLIARKIRRRGGLTRQDKTAPKFPDLLKRDFTASAPNSRWVGDRTEIPTAAASSTWPR